MQIKLCIEKGSEIQAADHNGPNPQTLDSNIV